MNISKNEKVRIGDSQFGGAATATLDFAKDKRGDYILDDDEVIADAGDGIDTYEVLKVMPGNKVKLGGLGVEVATVDAKTVSVTRKHGILKRDGDTVVLNSALDYSNIRRILSKFNFRTNFGNQVEYVEAPESRDNNIVIIGYKESSGWGGGSEVPISQGLAMKMIAELKKVYRVDSSVLKSGKLFVTGGFTNKATNSSRNLVVANAIAWKAKNAVYALGHKFEKGDDVAFKGNTLYKGKVVDAEVHGNRDTFYIVKWNDGKTYRVTESDLVKA